MTGGSLQHEKLVGGKKSLVEQSCILLLLLP